MPRYIDEEKVESILYGITAYKNTIPLDSAIFNIRRVPTADVVEVKHGYWYVDERPESSREVICSVCEEPIFRYHDPIDWRPKYCPNCGAIMDLRGEM